MKDFQAGWIHASVILERLLRNTLQKKVIMTI